MTLFSVLFQLILCFKFKYFRFVHSKNVILQVFDKDNVFCFIQSLVHVTKMGLNLKIFICILITTLYAVNSTDVIKIATVVPRSSPWRQVLDAWAETVAKKNKSRLEIQLFYNGVQGDEDAIVRKMKISQLDGALLTTVGLGRIYTPILGLQMPGLFKTWSKLYTARQAMDSDFQQGMNSAGFNFLGWSDFGAVHLLSKGFAVRTPKDVKGKKVFIDINNRIDLVLSQVISNFTSVPVSVSDVITSKAYFRFN